jgi:hypothetical protein
MPSADLQSAAQLLLWVDESKGKEEMLDYAFILESHEFEFGRRAGRALRWAVQRNLIEKCRKGPLTEEENETMMRSSVVAADHELLGKPHTVTASGPSGGVHAPREETRSMEALAALIDDEAVEDGVIHRAEAVLKEHIKKFGGRGLAEFALRATPGARAASILRLLGRVKSINHELRHELVRRGLESASVEVRAAAVQAAETWEEAGLASLLRDHNESVTWLSDYARRVADDIEG